MTLSRFFVRAAGSAVRPACFALLLIPAWRGAVAAGGPNSWRPPRNRPPFRELLEGDEYARRFAEALTKIDVEALKASKSPASGIEVLDVTKGGQADALGIRKGDFILELDGQPLTYRWQFNPLREWREQTILVHHADGRREKLRIKPGKIGVGMWGHWAPELEYLRGEKRDRRWDSEVLVALKRFKSSPILAETAWHHAVRKGYRPGPLSDGIGSEIAATLGRYREAMDLAWLAIQADPGRHRAANLFAEIAMATFNVDRGLSLLRRYPALVINDMRGIEKLIAEWRLHAPEGEASLSPIALAARRLRTDVLAIARPLNEVTHNYVGHLAGGGAHLNPPRGFHIPVVFGPSARDVEMAVRFKAKPKTNKKSPSYLTVGWADQDLPAFDEAKRCPHFHGGFALEISEGGFLTIRHHVRDIGSSRPFHDVHLDHERENVVHMAVCDRQCEAVLNGHRVFYGPFPSDVERLVPVLKAVSMEVRIEEISVYSLGDPVEVDDDQDDVF